MYFHQRCHIFYKLISEKKAFILQKCQNFKSGFHIGRFSRGFHNEPMVNYGSIIRKFERVISSTEK